MLFSSPEFIFVFLPITFFVYFFLTKRVSFYYAKVWLLLASLVFYAYWHPVNVLLIMGSMLFNFSIGKQLYRGSNKPLLVFAVVANLALLGYYKYTDFLLSNVNLAFGTDITLLHIALPLGISFFTFQQIGFLVDNYTKGVHDFKFIDYCLFVTFFPQLIAGPIVHHAELMPQFAEAKNRVISTDNIAKGLLVFNLGLAKKLVIADNVAVIVSTGYSNSALLGSVDAWITSFAYSVQLYFDFSGYSDMAIGLGLLFNVVIPLNFNSPYRAVNIQDFWRRWHMTLSRFLRDYIYIPLGGSKNGEWFTYRNLFITFLLGGIWHGAGWTFVLWGALHGCALVIHRAVSKSLINIPNWVGVTLTFLFVNFAWIFFKAPTWDVAVNMVEAMSGLQQRAIGFALINDYYFLPIWIASIILLFRKNTQELAAEFVYSWKWIALLVAVIVLNLIFLNSAISQEFLYFDF